MRSECEARLIRSESALPGFKTLLQAEDLARVAGMQPGCLTLEYIRYKPGTSCLAAYRYRIEGRDDFYYAKTHEREVQQTKIDNAHKKTPALSEPPKQVADSTLLYRFPQDAKLRSLWKLESRHGRQKLFDRVGLETNEDTPIIVLAYKPERRCVIQVGSTRCDIVKLYTKSGWLTAHANAKKVSNCSELATAPLLGKSLHHRALRFGFASGPTLREQILHGVALPQIGEVAHLLARLHASRLRFPVVLNRSEERAVLVNSRSLLCHLIPESRSEIHHCVEYLSRWLQTQSERLVPCHGDFYDKQVIQTSSGPLLLDFDQACKGDPRQDVANFVAHVLALDVPKGEILVDEFLQAYCRYSSLETLNVNPYIAFCLLKLAHHPFRSGTPDWPERTIRLINKASARLEKEEVQI